MRVRLNGQTSEDGEMELFVGGESVIKADGLVLREAAGNFRGVMYQTFFGGMLYSHPAYVTRTDCLRRRKCRLRYSQGPGSSVRRLLDCSHRNFLSLRVWPAVRSTFFIPLFYCPYSGYLCSLLASSIRRSFYRDLC